MTQTKFDYLVYQRITKEYESYENNVDSRYRECSTYQTIKHYEITKAEKEFGMKVRTDKLGELGV